MDNFIISNFYLNHIKNICLIILEYYVPRLNSAKINLWVEAVDSSISSFFSVMMDILHVMILIRFLSQEEIGIFFFSYAILYLLSQIPTGYGVAIRKKASEYNENRSIYLWNGLIITAPTLLFCFILYWLSIPFIVNYSAIQLTYSIVFSTILATIGFGILELARYYLAGCNQPGLAERVRAVVGKISMITLTLIFMFIYPSIESALIAVFITYTLTGLYILYLSPNKFVKPSKEVSLELLRFSKWSLPTGILNDFYRRWDTILLGFMVGSISLGYYDSSLRIAFLSAVLGVGLAKSGNVKVSGLYETGEDVVPISRQLIIASSLLVIPFLLVVSFNSEFILKILYGPEYIEAKWFLIGLVVVQLFQSYTFQFETIFNGINSPEKTTKTSAIAVVFNVVTAPFLVILFGGLGVIYSTIISEIVRIIVYEYEIKQKFNDYILPKGVLLQFVISFGIYIFITVVNSVFSLSNISLLIFSLSISVFGFYYILYRLSPEVKDIIHTYLQNR